MTLPYGSWSEGHHDLYFTVQWFCLISWRHFDIWTPLQDYESVWYNIWPQNKWRPLWPIFHGPVSLPYILKTVWYMNIILQNYESVWPNIWPQNKCRSLWPIFHGPVILPCIWRLFDIWTPYFGIMSQYDMTFDLKINVGHCDRYFMVQWFCLISWSLFDVWSSYFRIMSQYDPAFDLKLNVGHCDLFSWSSDFALHLEHYLLL